MEFCNGDKIGEMEAVTYFMWLSESLQAAYDLETVQTSVKGREYKTTDRNITVNIINELQKRGYEITANHKETRRLQLGVRFYNKNLRKKFNCAVEIVKADIDLFGTTFTIKMAINTISKKMDEPSFTGHEKIGLVTFLATQL